MKKIKEDEYEANAIETVPQKQLEAALLKVQKDNRALRKASDEKIRLGGRHKQLNVLKETETLQADSE